MSSIKISKKIYLDYAAATPVAPEVLKTMTPYFSEKFGNPSSLHYFGQEALKAVDESREKIAETIGAEFREIIFTGSATEANNLTLRGIIKEFRIQNIEYRKFLNTKSYILKPRLIVSSIEHESILETARDLEKEGVEVIYLPVDKNGFVDLEKLKESLNERTILVSIMYANNIIGTIQPIKEIAKIIKQFKKEQLAFNSLNPKPHTLYPIFHTDAVQAFQYLDCDVNSLGVDLMTLSSHKIYGPKGIGALYARQSANREAQSAVRKRFAISDLRLASIITGGGQEFGLRSGTENVPAIAGFAKAAELAVKNREKETKRIAELADYFWKEIKKIEPKVKINEASNVKSQMSDAKKLPNILNIYFPNQNAQDLLIKLDMAGIAISSGAACSARAMKPSYVLKAIGLSEQKIKNSLRFSFGKFTTKKEIGEAIKRMEKIL